MFREKYPQIVKQCEQRRERKNSCKDKRDKQEIVGQASTAASESTTTTLQRSVTLGSEDSIAVSTEVLYGFSNQYSQALTSSQNSKINTNSCFA